LTLRAARRAASATALTLASCALTLPFAAPARATAPAERIWTIVDSDGDGSYGLNATNPTSKVDESLTSEVTDLSSSADGTRVIYSRQSDSGQTIVVRDMSGRYVRTVSSLPSTSTSFDIQPVLSPDGKTAVWTRITMGASSFSFSVLKVAVASGSPTTLVANRGVLAFLDNGTLLTQSMTNGTYAATTLTGSTETVSGNLPTGADQFMVSPLGDKIAWYEDTTPDASDVSTGDVKVASLTDNGGSWTVGSATTLSGALDNEQPAFSRDGLSLRWVQYDGNVGPGDVISRPVDASAPAAPLGTTADDELDVAVTAAPSDDVTAPGAATATPFTLNGTTPVIRWTPPADADLSGVLITRRLHGSATKQIDRLYVPAPLASYTDKNLVLGQTYDYTLETVDRAGKIGPAVSRSLTAIKPGPVFGVPTSAKSTKTTFPVAFAAGALSTTKLWVDFVPAGGTTWQHWVNGVTGPIRTFGVAGTTGVASTTATAGQSYGFHVKAQDAYGNTSAFVNGTDKAVVPYDQTKASLYGGTTVASTSAYLGSYRRLTTSSQYAKVTLVGNRLQVVGWKCSGCGSFAIYDGATKVATVSTYSASTIARTVLYTRSYSASGTHTFTIKPVGTAGHPAVLLDGFAMRR
jgi:hypothetical protein